METCLMHLTTQGTWTTEAGSELLEETVGLTGIVMSMPQGLVGNQDSSAVIVNNVAINSLVPSGFQGNPSRRPMSLLGAGTPSGGSSGQTGGGSGGTGTGGGGTGGGGGGGY